MALQTNFNKAKRGDELGLKEARRRLSKISVIEYRSLLKYVDREEFRTLEVSLGFDWRQDRGNHMLDHPGRVKFYSCLLDKIHRVLVVRCDKIRFFLFQKVT